MGRPKAIVRVDGTLLWRRQVELLQRLGPAELLISAGEDWDAGVGPWTVVRDRWPRLGPLGGIGAALRAMSTELLLVLAVDMPSMSAGFLRGLIESAGPHGVVPVENDLYQGLAAVYPRSVLALVEEALGGGDHSIHFLVDRALRQGLVVARPIADSEKPLFRNVNRPADIP